jgi:hypothetical protein
MIFRRSLFLKEIESRPIRSPCCRRVCVFPPFSTVAPDDRLHETRFEFYAAGATQMPVIINEMDVPRRGRVVVL